MATAIILNYTKCIVRISKEDIILFEIAESSGTGQSIFRIYVCLPQRWFNIPWLFRIQWPLDFCANSVFQYSPWQNTEAKEQFTSRTLESVGHINNVWVFKKTRSVWELDTSEFGSLDLVLRVEVSFIDKLLHLY